MVAGTPLARVGDRAGTHVPATAVPVCGHRPDATLRIGDVKDETAVAISRLQEFEDVREGDFGLLFSAMSVDDRTIDRGLQQLALLQAHDRHVLFDDVQEIFLDVRAEIDDGQFAVAVHHPLVAGDEVFDGRQVAGFADFFQQGCEDLGGSAAQG